MPYSFGDLKGTLIQRTTPMVPNILSLEGSWSRRNKDPQVYSTTDDATFATW